MDDTLKSAIFGLLGLIVIHGSLERRVHHDAARQINEAFDGTGKIETRVTTSGMFGILSNRIYAVDVFGEGMATSRLPFTVIPRSGWKGNIRHLRLHLRRFQLNGVAVDRFEADIPNVSYDLGHALYKDRLVMRSAGHGPAVVTIGPESLRKFVLKKYSGVLDDVAVSFPDKQVSISGSLLLFARPTPFSAIGRLRISNGRYIELVEPVVQLNGRPMLPGMMQLTLSRINPVLDVDVDLGLRGYFRMESVRFGDNEIEVSGEAGIPTLAETASDTKEIAK